MSNLLSRVSCLQRWGVLSTVLLVEPILRRRPDGLTLGFARQLVAATLIIVDRSLLCPHSNYISTIPHITPFWMTAVMRCHPLRQWLQNHYSDPILAQYARSCIDKRGPNGVGS